MSSVKHRSESMTPGSLLEKLTSETTDIIRCSVSCELAADNFVYQVGRARSLVIDVTFTDVTLTHDLVQPSFCGSVPELKIADFGPVGTGSTPRVHDLELDREKST